MDMTQILIFGLCLVPVCRTERCLAASELDEFAENMLRSRYPRPAEPPRAAQPGAPAVCPLAMLPLRAPEHLHDRSLSPWRHVLVTKEDHFPATYSEAQCLCSGCILIQGNKPPVESHNYNSSPITQSRVFLKRELCKDGQKYHLKPVSVKVAVGCTCTRAKSYN